MSELPSRCVGVALAVGSSNILVVEDNADDSFMLTRQLKKVQVDDKVTIIEDGKVALNFLLNSVESPVAIFLDLRLPGLSGIELLRKVREEPRLDTVPVIIMTGSVDPEMVSECNRLGVTAVLEKPIGLYTFVKTVAPLFPKATVVE